MTTSKYCAWMLGVALCSPAVTFAAERTSPSGDAVSLVREALRAELAGHDRAALLSQALALDPNCEQARWQSGYVRIGDQWVKVDDVPQAMADDAKLAAYDKRRAALVDTADNQRELARWCRKNRLPAEARVHWAKLLEFEPQDAEALAALGLQWHDGRLMTRSQLVAARKQAGERLRARRHWQPQTVKWRAAIIGSDGPNAAAAREELGQLDDPAALPALESVFAANPDSELNNRLNLLLIETAARMHHPDATDVLLRRAVNPDSPDVRAAACRALAKRPMHTYVPALIAALPVKTSTKFSVYMLPNGAVMHEHTVTFDGARGRETVSYESSVLPTDAGIAQLVTPRALANESSKAAAIERRVAALEAVNRHRRERVQFALHATTGFEDPDDPEVWNKAYAEYYGWKVSDEPKSERKTHFWEAAVYYPIPESRQPTAAPSNSTPSNFHIDRELSPHEWLAYPAGSRHHCFPAGTPVLTIHGPRPIETLQPGDRVLSQHPDTGELAYKTVTKRTLRPGVKLLRMDLGERSIVATYGHAFWVVGSGWDVAGHLEPGTRLRGLEGDVTVARIEPVPSQEVYNLLVTDFASYFVGDERLLVHDDSPLTGTTTLVPGLAAQESHP